MRKKKSRAEKIEAVYGDAFVKKLAKDSGSISIYEGYVRAGYDAHMSNIKSTVCMVLSGAFMLLSALVSIVFVVNMILFLVIAMYESHNAGIAALWRWNYLHTIYDRAVNDMRSKK